MSPEVSGTVQGKSLRRAVSHKLSVGVKDRKGTNKGGAIEYPAAEAQPPEAPEAIAPPAGPAGEGR